MDEICQLVIILVRMQFNLTYFYSKGIVLIEMKCSHFVWEASENILRLFLVSPADMDILYSRSFFQNVKFNS